MIHVNYNETEDKLQVSLSGASGAHVSEANNRLVFIKAGRLVGFVLYNYSKLDRAVFQVMEKQLDRPFSIQEELYGLA